MDKWSLIVGWIGIAAFVLAIPMAVIANVFTPKVQVWWATTSRKRMLSRTNEIKSQLTEGDLQSLGQLVAECTNALLSATMAIACMIIVGTVTTLRFLTSEFFPSLQLAILVYVVLVGALGIYYVMQVVSAIRNTSRLRGKFFPNYRADLEQELLALNSSLSLADNSTPSRTDKP